MVSSTSSTRGGASPNGVAPRLETWPNAVTLARTVAAVGLGALAVARADLVLLLVAYAVYWVGDVADGWLARHLDQETRVGGGVRHRR